MPDTLAVLTTGLTKGQATNSTATAFTAAMSLATTTEPVKSATRTVIDLGPIGRKERTTLRVWPYGGNTNNDVINVKVQGWNRVAQKTTPAYQWISGIICEVQGTLSNALTGTAGEAMVATEFFCDDITLTTGVAVIHKGTADIDNAWIECDVSPFELVEILGDLGAGGDTMNWFWGF